MPAYPQSQGSSNFPSTPTSSSRGGGGGGGDGGDGGGSSGGSKMTKSAKLPPLPPSGPAAADGGGTVTTMGSKTAFSEAKSVFSALKRYDAETGLAYSDVPEDVCQSREIHFSSWSLVASDQTCLYIAAATKRRLDERAAAALAKLDFNPRFASSMQMAQQGAMETAKHEVGLLTLDLTGAHNVGDLGLRTLSEHCDTLRDLSIAGAFKVSDVGLRSMALACTGLTSLNLAGCLGVAGVGLGVVGERAKSLTKLNLNNCRMSNWSFQKVCEGCKRLEDLDISNCTQLTDHDVKAMAEHCVRLRKINLRDARQVSDGGLVEVAKKCRGLEWLDTSRGDMSFTVTDVGVLSLAENCPLLTHLVLEGCDHVTDVGFTWIGRGCRALTHLDAKNCCKITNAGVRALCEGCRELRFLDLTNMTRVTDVGVRQVAAYLKHIQHLNLSGIYLITDGMKRDFGLEGLQALGTQAPELTFLHMVGCFQVSRLALRAIFRSAFAGHLLDLSFAGCPKLDEQAFVKLCQMCPSLTALSVAGCTAAVTDRMVEAVGRNCHAISKMDLSECELVTQHGLGWVVKGCKQLHSLICTGCTGLDDFAMLPFAEAGFTPGLHTLLLNGCPGVGDTGLSWVADGCCGTIRLLNIRGTRCTTAALRSVADQFKYCSMRKNHNFMGFYPERRYKDRIVINEYGLLYRSTTRVQSAFRGRVGRRKAQIAKELYYMRWVALRFQSNWRRRLAQELVELMKWEKKQREWAATMIWGFAKIIKAKDRLQELRDEAWEKMANHMATQIQKRYRGVLGRRTVSRIRELLRQLRLLHVRSAQLIQRVYRGMLGRKEMKRRKQAHMDWLEFRLRCTKMIQRIFRGKKARDAADAKRRAQERERAMEEAAVKVLQRSFRTHRTHELVMAAVNDKKERAHAAVVVQTQWRSLMARNELNMRRQIRMQEQEEDAARLVQCAYRCKKAREVLLERKTESDTLHKRQDAAARVIQRLFRSYRAWRRMKQIREQRAAIMARMIELENWAAIKVQAHYRGNQGRKIHLELVRTKQRSWKEMWDEEKKRPFYYNQITGEIRWRKPQALLNSMRRPVCTNCEFYEGVTECQQCKEYYCNSCWDQVHCGGKRRRHNFRALYDFYDKRIDYGDEEWPSRWPTEIEQDDMAGWQLRVGEKFDRLPAVTLGDWQKFDDDSKAGSQRSFYYNALTNEGMYEQPPEWAKLEREHHAEEELQREAHHAELLAQYPHRPALPAAHPGPPALTGGHHHHHGGRAADARVARHQLEYQGQGAADGAVEATPDALSWTEEWDAVNSTFYYYNHTTGETTYTRPADFAQPPTSLVQFDDSGGY